jgi:hypothetical protein
MEVGAENLSRNIEARDDVALTVSACTMMSLQYEKMASHEKNQ